jgi:hypothetical protein
LLIEEVQDAINDPNKITDVSSLLKESQVPIENVMDFVTEVPGFPERYPELADEEQLEAVPEKPAEGGVTPAGGPPAEGDNGEAAEGDPGQPSMPPAAGGAADGAAANP